MSFFPGRRGGSRIFHLQVRLSGRVPQICCLFGPSAAGGAYMPAFTDWVGMVEGNASMYLASPRIAEMTTGERSSLEEMGGAELHTTESGVADDVFPDDATLAVTMDFMPLKEAQITQYEGEFADVTGG